MDLRYQDELIEAGVDEAGRGCLAGPVVAAAVILPDDFHHPYINDSKQLSIRQRDILRPIIEKEALAYGVAFIDHKEIDEINILQASIKAMHEAIALLNISPGFLLIDGNRFIPYAFTPHLTVVKGDAKYQNIAAASILAKSHRDQFMHEMHLQFPHYGWDTNMGYPTKKHRDGIRKYGISPIHRMSFRLLND